ncbi:hypothetical protein ALI144C_20605 [Actinosynnema sp. ALI-1.44]|nr:hypothetical protein ALI144C_20605 [Actinosynnema sp. ALI-1.44]
MHGRGETWFAVLPDHPAAHAAAGLTGAHANRTVSYPSTRPWLVGQWPDEEVVLAEAGDTRLAIVGHCPITAAELAKAAARVRTPADLDRLALTLPGSFHLIAVVAGRLRVQGSASGLRKVFHTRVSGVTVAADHARLLATATGAGISQRWLDTCLLTLPPHPLDEVCPWHGVETVPADSYLLVENGTASRTVRWWHPPEPELSLAEGAAKLRDALSTAVAVRTRAGGLVSCDLSGGLDSTPICFLAARADVELTAFTRVFRDESSDDTVWAERAAAELPGVRHEVMASDGLPLPVAGLLDVRVPLEQPFPNAFQIELILELGRRMAATASRIHLTGSGGDEVVQGWPGFMHTLVRKRPLLAAHYLRAYRSLFRWPLLPTVRALADRRPYGAWLADSARDLTGPLISETYPPLEWDLPPRLPPYATAHAEHAARTRIVEAAAGARPLAGSRGQHGSVHGLRRTSGMHRVLASVIARTGVRYDAPFFDDRVVEAGLAVREHERITPWRFKPLTLAAMRGVMPDHLLRRNTKGTPTIDEYQGFRRYRADVLALWEDSRLAKHGLVDADRLRAACTQPDPHDVNQPAVLDTVAVELWLRAAERATTGKERGNAATAR